ncbi:hypothetical protein ILUMI_24206 [Ignelater luminosus]|uniref:DUF5641 domain-containing protein n=1 Tax=Ignelater luminosus TaxID=2038154 RepID=A0A8K0G144_IGNLU|nr:hypothetical protein ILUMI_24206 [Ignelater luminosus]
MYALLSLIESCLNSRPLTPLSNDPNDLEVLTPRHFLIGKALTAQIEPTLINLPDNRLSRWQKIQKLQQCFWSRWQSEYLIELQRRHKWQRPVTSLKIGAMIIIKEDNLLPPFWRLGRKPKKLLMKPRREVKLSRISKNISQLRQCGIANCHTGAVHLRYKATRDEEIINAVLDEPGISTSTIRKLQLVCREDLHPYYYQRVHHLQLGDEEHRLAFSH